MIVSFEGNAVFSAADFNKATAEIRPGTEVDIGLLRGEARLTVKLTAVDQLDCAKSRPPARGMLSWGSGSRLFQMISQRPSAFRIRLVSSSWKWCREARLMTWGLRRGTSFSRLAVPT